MKNSMLRLAGGIWLFSYSLVCAQWQTNPSLNTVISTNLYDQQDARIISDGKGGAIITWVDFRADASQTVADIYAQRIDKNGYVKWTTGGVSICNQAADQTAPVIEEDGAGGAIISWQDFRGGDRDIFAQRIDSTGNTLWGTYGTPVVVKASHQRNPRLLSDGNNGAFVIWEDSANGNIDIYAQHIGGSGIYSWSADGIVICNAANSQINPKVCSDTQGGAIICWQDKRTSVDYDIYAQRINSAGQVQWTNNGIAICNSVNTQSNPKISTNNVSGGAFVVWQDKRGGISYDVYAQSVSNVGAIQWTANGIVLCNAIGSQSAIDMISDNVTNGAIVAWKDGRNGKTNIYAQYLNTNGTGAWSTNGVLLSTTTRDQVNPNLVTDGNGGAIVVWQDSLSTYDIYAQRINTNGSIQWASGGVIVANAAANQTSPKNVSDGSGGCIFSFQDKRSGNFDIYAHWLNASGIVGVEKKLSENTFVKLYPNPAQNYFTVDINFNTSSFVIYNVVGELVYSASSVVSGQRIYHELNTGVYFVCIRSETNNELYTYPLTITE